ncbi:tyrosine-protein phosphatase [Micromonospora profundi]|uniref:tyrosine-protein phosphatase n=1 Tax=Micromonospora TaxID=1873 RepID=UPI0006ADF033|nr:MULTISPECIES: tyrosine-protein phosphatase [Micromonospora]KOX06857.1 protein tyrosine phosphatase [Micromonospora sp. NRRL B-16802]NJC11200.1 protein-tyrosine phosphatase [Micromonospora profundi]
MGGRNWELIGAPNARDLGGLVTVEGRRVRPGRLIRTPALGRLTDEDLPVLAKLGPTCVLDLRDHTEIAVAPADRLTGEPRVVHLPVHDPDHPVFTYVSAVLLGHDLDAYAELARQGTAGAMADIYRWFVAGEAACANFGAAVRLAAQPENLPLVYHCSAGKDRTGWLTVILLSALGVDEAAIRAEYLRNNELTDSLRAVLIEAMRRRRPTMDVDAVLPVLEVRPEYLDAGYQEVRLRHGSFDGYLRNGLGLTDDVLTALRAQLLE